jgi:predicted RNA-binding protein
MKEIIDKERWDLEGLQGATENQLLHPHFEEAKNWFFNNYKPKSNIAVLTLCSETKPYHNSINLKHSYKICKVFNVDHIVVSNPGLIPIEYDSLYPFMYYNWPEKDETKELKELYTKVLRERIEEWFNYFSEYEYIISYVRFGETRDAINSLNIPQKIYDCFNEENIEKLKQHYPNVKNPGMFKQRLITYPLSRYFLINKLEEITGKKSDLIIEIGKPVRLGIQKMRQHLLQDWYTINEILDKGLFDGSKNTILFQLSYHLPRDGYQVLKEGRGKKAKCHIIKKEKTI